MPKAEEHDVEHLERILGQHGAKHLSGRKYGATLIVESGPSTDPSKRFRLRRETVHLWCLDMADHRGRWERTPFRDTLEKLTNTVFDDFPWTVAE